MFEYNPESNNWINTTLESVCNGITDGSHNPPASGEKSNNLMISSKNIHDGIIDYEDPRYLTDTQFITENKRTNVQKNDLLMTIVGTIGRTAIVPDLNCKLTFQRSVSILHPRHELINVIYLKASLDRIQPDVERLAHGSSQKGIYLNQVKLIQIKLPPLELQNQFAVFVKQVDKSKLVFRAMVSKLDELVNNRFNEMFGVHSEYDKSPLSALLKQYYIPEKIDNPQLESYITLSSHGKGVKKRIIPEGKTPVPFTGCRIKTGQFISSRLHAKEGAFGIIPSELSGSVVSKDFPVFDINTNAILPEYLITCVCQKSFYSQFMNYSYGSTTKRRIKEDVFLDFVIPLPPLNKQQEFVLFQKQVDKLKFQQAS